MGVGGRPGPPGAARPRRRRRDALGCGARCGGARGCAIAGERQLPRGGRGGAPETATCRATPRRPFIHSRDWRVKGWQSERAFRSKAPPLCFPFKSFAGCVLHGGGGVVGGGAVPLGTTTHRCGVLPGPALRGRGLFTPGAPGGGGPWCPCHSSGGETEARRFPRPAAPLPVCPHVPLSCGCSLTKAGLAVSVSD